MQNDILTIEKIKMLLYEKKYSIAGAKKQIVKEKKLYTDQIEIPLTASTAALETLKETKRDLLKIKDILEKGI